jgi:hypothetical protein
MFAMAQNGTDFPACIIVRKGLEGTLASGSTQAIRLLTLIYATSVCLCVLRNTGYISVSLSIVHHCFYHSKAATIVCAYI